MQGHEQYNRFPQLTGLRTEDRVAEQNEYLRKAQERISWATFAA